MPHPTSSDEVAPAPLPAVRRLALVLRSGRDTLPRPQGRMPYEEKLGRNFRFLRCIGKASEPGKGSLANARAYSYGDTPFFLAEQRQVLLRKWPKKSAIVVIPLGGFGALPHM